MEKSRLINAKLLALKLFLIAIGVYFFIAFLPFPSPIRIGLDPSWQYAISQAAEDGLIFGKDIIFTYGPLGYLVAGVPLERNFWLITAFRLLVYFSLYTIAIIKILTLRTHLQKILLTLSLLLPFLLRFSTDYQILFAFIIILSFEEPLKKSIHLWSLGFGAFAGFCLLTKFTLGIGILGSLILFLVGNLYTSIKSKLNITTSCFALINSLLAAISVSFILLAPDYYLLNLTKILACLALAILAGILSYVIQQKKNSQRAQDNVNETSKQETPLNRLKVRISSWWIFYLVYSGCLIGVIVYSYPSLTEYIANSWEISSGYSSAMSSVGPRRVVLVAISELLLILALLILVIKERKLGFGLALFLTLFLGFKHGFVRQDGHILIFVSLTSFLVAICLSKLKTNRFKKLAYFLNLYVLTLALLFPTLQRLSVKPIDSLRPALVANKLTSIFNLNSLEARISAETDANLAQVKLPKNVINFVKDSSIDIIPWEISLVAANQLNWKPRPIFQSYSAYTTQLDNINLESFSKDPRDYLLYEFASIDGRHPFFDEPKTFAYVFCNYNPSSQVPDFISNPAQAQESLKLLLLEKQSSSRCLANPGGEKLSVSWRKPISINLEQDNSFMTAHIQLNYSIIGKLYKVLYRVPPVMMQVNYQDGTRRQYRIIPENSSNGVFVSHLPRNDEEVLAFFRGELPAPVESFSFRSSHPWVFKPTVEINFSPVSLIKN
ncbi:MAG: hypothetical protein ACRDEA_02265 [Microcystaceae cyanobacterium]